MKRRLSLGLLVAAIAIATSGRALAQFVPPGAGDPTGDPVFVLPTPPPGPSTPPINATTLEALATNSCTSGVGLGSTAPTPYAPGAVDGGGLDQVLDDTVNPGKILNPGGPSISQEAYTVGSFIWWSLAGLSLLMWFVKSFRRVDGFFESFLSFEAKIFGLAVTMLALQFAAGEGVFAGSGNTAIVRLSNFASDVAQDLSRGLGPEFRPNTFKIDTPGDAYAIGTCEAWKIAAIPILSNVALTQKLDAHTPLWNIWGQAADAIGMISGIMMTAVPALLAWVFALLIFGVIAIQLFLVKWSALVLGAAAIFLLGFSAFDVTAPWAQSYWRYVAGNALSTLTITFSTIFAAALIDATELKIAERIAATNPSTALTNSGISGLTLPAVTSLQSLGETFFIELFVFALVLSIPAMTGVFVSGAGGLSAGNVLAVGALAAGAAGTVIGAGGAAALGALSGAMRNLSSTMKNASDNAGEGSRLASGQALQSKNAIASGTTVPQPDPVVEAPEHPSTTVAPTRNLDSAATPTAGERAGATAPSAPENATTSAPASRAEDGGPADASPRATEDPHPQDAAASDDEATALGDAAGARATEPTPPGTRTPETPRSGTRRQAPAAPQNPAYQRHQALIAPLYAATARLADVSSTIQHGVAAREIATSARALSDALETCVQRCDDLATQIPLSPPGNAAALGGGTPTDTTAATPASVVPPVVATTAASAATPPPDSSTTLTSSGALTPRTDPLTPSPSRQAVGGGEERAADGEAATPSGASREQPNPTPSATSVPGAATSAQPLAEQAAGPGGVGAKTPLAGANAATRGSRTPNVPPTAALLRERREMGHASRTLAAASRALEALQGPVSAAPHLAPIVGQAIAGLAAAGTTIRTNGMTPASAQILTFATTEYGTMIAALAQGGSTPTATLETLNEHLGMLHLESELATTSAQHATPPRATPAASALPGPGELAPREERAFHDLMQRTFGGFGAGQTRQHETLSALLDETREIGSALTRLASAKQASDRERFLKEVQGVTRAATDGIHGVRRLLGEHHHAGAQPAISGIHH